MVNSNYSHNLISTGISSLTALEELNLCGNKVAAYPKSFPSSLSKLGNSTFTHYILTHYILDLTANGLVEIPVELMSASTLKILELSRNKIKELPYSIKNMTNLTTLNLKENKYLLKLAVTNYFLRLSKLRDQITSCKSLESLLLSGNRLVSLPEKLGDLSNLTYLDLSKNSLSSLPSTMPGIYFPAKTNIQRSLLLLN